MRDTGVPTLQRNGRLAERARDSVPAGKVNRQRYLSIDIMRGVAIILMIQVHFVENLSPHDSSAGWLYDLSLFLGSLPAPLFTFVSGLSYGLWVRKQEAARRADEEITAITLRRGLFLFVVGIAFNFFIWLPDETFNWDILTLIGTSLLLLALARKLPLPVLALICLLVLLFSPPLRVMSDYWAYWKDDAYEYDFTFRDVAFGFLANGYFPVFPWVIFPIIGFLCGEVLFASERPPAQELTWLGAVGVGLLALAGIGIVAASLLPSIVADYYASGVSEFPASTEYLFATLGFVFVSLVLLHLFVDCGRRVTGTGRIVTMVRRYSTFSLTIYVLHHMVILWPLWAYAVLTGHDDPTFYWRRAMTTPTALGLCALFMVVCHFILIWSEKHKGFTLEALMRQVCDRHP